MHGRINKMPEYLAPGVYVEEVSFRGKSIEDIGLAPNTLSQVDSLSRQVEKATKTYLKTTSTRLSQVSLGVRALFTGASGTGKTLAASWLAAKLGLPLYRVDLASITSKYIGETEKNLANLLARAEQSEVILLFDEADSLFGKRSGVSDAHDRYANTETNDLLQRIESCKGMIILATNRRDNIDDAFFRRMDYVIDFPRSGSKNGESSG